MPIRNPLQEQLLKAGLINKAKAAQAAREQAKRQNGKGAAGPSPEQLAAQHLHAEKVERDRALAAQRNAQARVGEIRAQIHQIVEAHKLKREGEIAYRFTDGAAIKDVLVNEALRAQLASGSLVIARHGPGYELLPRAAAEKIYERDAAMIVLDHGRGEGPTRDPDDDYYKQFDVPDDLIW